MFIRDDILGGNLFFLKLTPKISSNNKFLSEKLISIGNNILESNENDTTSIIL